MSEGSTLLDAGNRIRTEAMQANIGEDLIIKGKNGVDLLDAKETYEEKVKQKSSSIGVSVSAGFTPAQMVSTVSDISNNIKDYGFGNASQTINTLGNGFQDLRNISSLTGNLRSWYEADGYIGVKGLVTDGLHNPVSEGNNLKDAAKGLVSASVTASYSQSSYESNTSGTKSVAGVINVGGNMVVQSEGDVRFVNQKITVGENIIIDAKNFEALAGENTYKNDTKSNSMGINAGYDIVNQNALGGLNASAGNSNTTSKSYDNTFISAGGTFQLTTTEDATFKGANVIADKINFDIGKNLNIISLQDEYKTHGESSNVGINVSGKMSGTQYQTGTATPSFGGGYSQNNGESKWVSNQTSIIAENGGSIKVNETLTNIGAVVGSLSDENKLSIDTKNLVIENLEDYNKGENYGMQVSGIGVGKDNKTPAPQTSIQYGSHDKEQNTNATFVNTEVTENGVKLDLDKLGINTDITKAQVVTKDEVVDQINTTLHTDLINTATRNQVIMDINGLIQLPGDVIKAALAVGENEGSNFLDNLVGTLRSTDSDMNNTLTMKDKYKKFNENKDLTNEKKAAGALILANDSANELRGTFGIDKDVPILVLLADDSKGQEAGSFYKEDGSILIFLDPSKIDMSNSKDVYNGLMYEMNHYNPSNPYTYNQSEKNIEKGYKLEENFTEMGRNTISGKGNSFYDEIMKGSNVIGLGNAVYSSLDEKDLDHTVAEPGDSKLMKSFANSYSKCQFGKGGKGCYAKVEKAANIAVKRNPPKSKESCDLKCQAKNDEKQQKEFLAYVNGEGLKPKTLHDLEGIVSTEAGKNNQVPPGYSKENFDIAVKKGAEAKFYDGQSLLKDGVLTQEEYNRYFGYMSEVQWKSTTRDILAPIVLPIILDKWMNSKNNTLNKEITALDPYKGVKNASEYLQKQGVPRTYRKQILESFDIDSINIIKASDSTYGIRFYDNVNAYEKGRYLFPSFDNSINRNGLALPYEWNNMTNMKQWKVEIDSTIIKGKVAPQIEFGSQYKGGAEQWYINDLNNLK